VSRRRIAIILLAFLSLLAACSNASDDGDSAGDDTATDGTSGSGELTYAEVLELPIDENVPVDAPGVDDSTIRVGGVASVTNPIGGPYGEVFDGVQAYFDYINDQGGIYGRQLELVAQEDDNTGFENREDVQNLLSQDLFAILPIATLDFSGADLIADANVPAYGWNINEEFNHHPNIFGERGFLCFTCATPGLPWLAQEVGATNIAILAYDVPQSADCAEGIQNSFDQFPTADIAFVDDSLPYGIPDLSAQVRDMKDAGVDMVTTCMDFNGVTTLQNEMRRQELDAVQYLPNGYDYDFLEENGDLFEGAYVRTDFVPFEVPDEDKPEGMALYLEWIDEQGGNVGELSLAGWLSADMFVTGLRAAGPEFSQQGVIDGLNQLHDYDAMGIVPDKDWAIEHDDTGPLLCDVILQIQDSEFVQQFSPPDQPFTCIEKDVTEVPEEPTFTD